MPSFFLTNNKIGCTMYLEENIMYTIKDNIVGEIITFSSKEKVIKEAIRRVKYHNCEFNYRHMQKHYSANCSYFWQDSTTIVIK